MGILLMLALVLIGSSVLIVRTRSEQTTTPPKSSLSPTSTPEPETVDPDLIGVDISATFTIITDDITRSFKAAKYHNQSQDVFITAADPTIVHVKKGRITWADFFATLPMKLTKECLITGDGETFCDGKQGTLRFYLNNVEEKNLLDKEIHDGDVILINFAL